MMASPPPAALINATRERLHEEIRTPYMVHNSLGVDVVVILDSDPDHRLSVANGERKPLHIDGLGSSESVFPGKGGMSFAPAHGSGEANRDDGWRSGLLTAHSVTLESRRFNARVRAVQIDIVGREIARVPFPLSENLIHEASLVCNVSVLNEQVGSSNLLELERENPEAMLESTDLMRIEQGAAEIRCDACLAASKVTRGTD